MNPSDLHEPGLSPGLRDDEALTQEELAALGVGADYMRPAERPAAWAAMAAGLRAVGRSPAQIAAELYLDEATVLTLLATSGAGTHADAFTTNPQIRALSIRQPWMWPVCHRDKVENRSWPAPVHLLGALFCLHAAGQVDRAAFYDDRIKALSDLPACEDLPRGAVVAVARLADCHAAAGDCCAPWGEPDLFHWRFDRIRLLPEPIACRGSLGPWRPDAELRAAVLGALGGAR
jgi:hypothetical protein